MATLKIRVIEARDLPIMDSQSGLTDAYVAIKHSDQLKKTPVGRKTLRPRWDFEVSFDLADYSELQEEPIEVKVWDHDTFTSDDLIGNVFLDLNTVLSTERPSFEGWFPIFDTMRGLRGEILLHVSLRFMGGGKLNPFIPWVPECRHGVTELQDKKLGPSIAAETESVLIFAVSRLDPEVYRVVKLVGMVEELTLRHDPEHARLQSLRSSRITNDSRILQFFKASGAVRRMLSRKTLEHGCNCILGYREHYDLEPSVGNIIIRGYGTCCQVARVIKDNNPAEEAVEGGILPNVVRRRRHMRNLHHLMKKATRLLTLKSLPANIIRRVGGIVTARSIKLITQLKTKAVVQERDSWWQEVREEIKVNARSFMCNAVIGYSESTTYFEDICVLSASGTAVVADWAPLSWSTEKQMQRQHSKHRGDACHITHIPLADSQFPYMAQDAGGRHMCLWCKKKPVPQILLATCEIPPDLPVVGTPRLVEARYVKKKDKESGEQLAIEISKMLPHIEYHIHQQLAYQLQEQGFNAAFGVQVDISMGSHFVVATSTATAVHVPCLPTLESEQLSLREPCALDLNYGSRTLQFSVQERLHHLSSVPVENSVDRDDEVKLHSPSQGPGHLNSSPSDSSSSTSTSTSSSDDSVSTQSSRTDTENRELRCKPFVIDLDDPEDRTITTLHVPGGCFVYNVDTVLASPVTLRPDHMITIQRRYELKEEHGAHPTLRLSRLFAHVQAALLFKIAMAGECSLACYKSEVSFASDNDINIRVMGYLMRPTKDKTTFQTGVAQALLEMEQRDSARRQRREDRDQGRVNALKLHLHRMRAEEHEKVYLNGIEISYIDRAGAEDIFSTGPLELKVDQPHLLRLPAPIVVTGYRICTSDKETGRDPVSWTVTGLLTIDRRKKKTVSFVLSKVEELGLPTERNSWGVWIEVPRFQPNATDPQSPSAVPANARKLDSWKGRRGFPHAETLETPLGTPAGTPAFPTPVVGLSSTFPVDGAGISSPRGDMPPLPPSASSEQHDGELTVRRGIPQLTLPEGALRQHHHADPQEMPPGGSSMSSPGSAGRSARSAGGEEGSKDFHHIDDSPKHDQQAKPRKKKRKPEHWEEFFLQASSPFCFRQLDVPTEIRSELIRNPSEYGPISLMRGTEEDQQDSNYVILTPMDYVPGSYIQRYHGFISYHFLRETEKVQGPTAYTGGLGTFFHYQMLEANHIVRRLVHSAGGNTLLAYNVVQHVMQDSDESRAAYHFITITGQIATIDEPRKGPVPTSSAASAASAHPE